MKKIEKTTAKQPAWMKLLKVAVIILSVIFSTGTVMLSGAGLIYNSDSYNDSIMHIGPLLIASGALLTLGAILACFDKNIPSLISSIPGFGLSMLMLRQLMQHADAAGWQDPQNPFSPVSDMYFERIMPVIFPFVLTIFIAIFQHFSYDAIEKRRLKKKLRTEKENAPAPKILGD